MTPTILCPTDFSEASERAVRFALETFASPDAELCLLHVDDLVEWGLPDDEAIEEPMRVVWRGQLDALAAAHAGEARVTIAVRRGRPAVEILKHAEAIGADLIAMATRGRSALGRAFLGAVAHKVVRSAPVPVLTVDPDARVGPVSRVLCAVDFSTPSAAALDEAIRLAERRGATLAVVHVSHVPLDYTLPDGTGLFGTGFREQLRAAAQEQLRELLEAHPTGASVTTEVTDGTPHAAIAEAAERHGADLVVVGTHGRTGLQRAAMGSVAERLVRTAAVPVMVVPDRAD